MLRRLTPAARQQLVQRVFACGTWPELRALEQKIAVHYAASPEQRAANEEELEWLRRAASARRQMVGRSLPNTQSGDR